MTPVAPTIEQNPLTFQDVWLSFKETERLMKERDAESDRKFKETERLMKETERLMKESAAETERLMKESAAETERLMKKSSAETERLMKDRDAESDRSFKETERLMKERAAETDRIVKNLSKNLGDLGNRLGQFVEHSVAPAVARLFQAEGIEVHDVYKDFESKRNGEALEIDLLVVNDGTLVVVECKSRLTHEHVDEHLRRMEKFKRVLPLYKNHQALGAVAAMVMSDSVKEYAHSQGLYVLCQNGDNMEISRPEGFVSTVW